MAQRLPRGNVLRRATPRTVPHKLSSQNAAGIGETRKFGSDYDDSRSTNAAAAKLGRGCLRETLVFGVGEEKPLMSGWKA